MMRTRPMGILPTAPGIAAMIAQDTGMSAGAAERMLANHRHQPEVVAESAAKAWQPSAEILAELRANRDGRALGEQHNHDPYRLAEARGLVVRFVPIADLQGKASPGRERIGRILPALNLIQIADDLSDADARAVCAHELAHAHGLDADDDAGTGEHGDTHRLADVWAKAFLGIDRLPWRGRE